jgi:hypothetical protein
VLSLGLSDKDVLRTVISPFSMIRLDVIGFRPCGRSSAAKFQKANASQALLKDCATNGPDEVTTIAEGCHVRSSVHKAGLPGIRLYSRVKQNSIDDAMASFKARAKAGKCGRDRVCLLGLKVLNRGSHRCTGSATLGRHAA